MARKERACSSCGARTTSKTGLCRPCKRPPNRTVLKPSDILTDADGRWVIRGGIRVWEAA